MTSPAFLRSPRLAALLLLLLGVPAWADDARLTTAAAVRALTPAEAAASRPVKIRGVVTYVTPNTVVFFVQDETGGVCVSGPRDKQLRPELKPGAVVEVEAVTAAGHALPHLTARKKGAMKVSIVGDDPLPEPKLATIAELAQPQFQEQRIEVSGVIRAMQTEPLGATPQETLLLSLADGNHRVTVALPGWRNQNDLPQQIVGATVRVRGVFTASPLERLPLFANRLFISSLKDLQIDQPASPPYRQNAQTVVAARELALGENDAERVRIQGMVTVSVPLKGMYVEDSTGGIWVSTINPAQPGEPVDAVGFVALHENNPVLEDAVWRRAERSLTLLPPLVTAADAMSGAQDGRLVRVEALLLGVSAAGEGPTLVLQSGERVFLARCGNPTSRLPSLGENSWLRVTGVCVNTRAPKFHDAQVPRSESFHLLIAGPQSIEIARTPTWWTVRRIVTVVASFAALALASAVWATTLRRRVAIQTDQIREHLAREAVSEERLRIARELHDSVQQDLLGITMQLKATERLLDRDTEKARHALTLASAMARHSQAETHRAVWDLRETADGQGDLVASLREMVAGMSTEESAKVEMEITGEPHILSPAIQGQVLRIAQEAVTNSLKHGRAGHIQIGLAFRPGQLGLTVRDDGQGFDADHPPSANSGHFGLFGMKERAIKLQAELRLTSRPGQGTTVALEVPLPAETDVNEPLHVASGVRLIPRPTTT